MDGLQWLKGSIVLGTKEGSGALGKLVVKSPASYGCATGGIHAYLDEGPQEWLLKFRRGYHLVEAACHLGTNWSINPGLLMTGRCRVLVLILHKDHLAHTREPHEAKGGCEGRQQRDRLEAASKAGARASYTPVIQNQHFHHSPDD